MQINRLFEIVYLLMNKKKMKATELAEHFEVSKRTILRDIDTLSAAGIPIYTSQGKGGGIFIHDRFMLNKAVISEEEQNKILFALQSMSATGFAETDAVFNRLRSLFENTNRNWIEVDFSRWGNIEEDRITFDTLKNALISEQCVSFIYVKYNGESIERKVYPIKLVFKSNAWYLQAYCLLKKDYRTFKIIRMKNLIRLNEHFNINDFNAPQIDVFYSNDYYLPDIEPLDKELPSLIEVTLLFAPCAYRIFHEFDEREIITNPNGSFTVKSRMPNDFRLCEYILSFGMTVEVLEPEEVREAMLFHAEIITKKYLKKKFIT
jgi:predicted DNA-binding transcriptional regulator YafY